MVVCISTPHEEVHEGTERNLRRAQVLLLRTYLMYVWLCSRCCYTMGSKVCDMDASWILPITTGDMVPNFNAIQFVLA